jgi:hypothetical protein
VISRDLPVTRRLLLVHQPARFAASCYGVDHYDGSGDLQPAMIVLPSASDEDDPKATDGCGKPLFVFDPPAAWQSRQRDAAEMRSGRFQTSHSLPMLRHDEAFVHEVDG